MPRIKAKAHQLLQPARLPPGPRAVLLDGAVLHARLTSAAGLQEGWARVFANQGAAGGDGMSVKRFAGDAAARLAALRASLHDGTYSPGPLRRVEIPKRAGGVRVLTIPCVADRIVQSAAALVLGPELDAEFEQASFGYRPGRSVQQAVRAVQAARSAGFTHVVDADIDSYFDRVSHDRLMARFAESVSDSALTGLIWMWLSHAFPGGRGLAQGSPLSPLLANLMLDRMDERLSRKGLRLVRYADDFVVLAHSPQGAHEALEMTARLLAAEGLQLNREKTRVMDFEAGFAFLGHLFVRSFAFRPEGAEEGGEESDALAEAEAALAKLGQAEAQTEAAQAQEVELREALAKKMEHGGLRHSHGMRVLHLHGGHSGAPRRLRFVPGALVVDERLPGPSDAVPRFAEVLAVPIGQVDRVEIGPGQPIDRDLIEALAAEDIPCALLDGEGGTRAWVVPGAASPQPQRQLAQAALIADPERRLDLARRFVLGGLRAERTQLRRLAAGLDQTPPRVTEALVLLSSLLPRGPGSNKAQEVFKGPLFGAASLDALRGQEGRAAKAWWAALGALVTEPHFALTRRLRPAGGDMANICLNVFAGLLTRDITVAVQRAGLHTGFGVLHGTRPGHDGAVYDLMEEFRPPLTGGLFIYAVNRRIIRPEHFTRDPAIRETSRPAGERRLTREGFAALIGVYETRVAQTVLYGPTGKRLRWRRLMLEQAQRLAAHCEGGAPYMPYDLDQDRREASPKMGDREASPKEGNREAASSKSAATSVEGESDDAG